MLFQNTSVTRGTAAMVVTATGMGTQMGQIATMLTIGDPHPVAAAEGARLADEGARHHRLDGGRHHRGRRPRPRRGLQRRAAARHGDGHLRHPHRPARVRVRDAVARRQAAGRGEGGGQEPDRRRDARRHQRDQHRQDGHADDEPDDGVADLRDRRRGSPSRARATQDRRDHGVAGVPVPDFTRLALGLVLDSDATVGRRRRRRRRPHRGRPGGARGQARRRRRGDPPRLPAPGRGAVRLRLQVHGDVPPGPARRRGARGPAGEGRARRRARALQQPGGPLSAAQVPIDEARADIDAANARMGEQGLRVLAFAARLLDEDELQAMAATPCRWSRPRPSWR